MPGIPDSTDWEGVNNPDFGDWWHKKGQYDPANSVHNPRKKKPKPENPAAGVILDLQQQAAQAKAETGSAKPKKQPTTYGGIISKQGGRPGAPQQGVMGAPNLGAMGGIQAWAAAVDKMYGPGAAQKYLQQRGINPTVNGYSAVGGGGSPAAIAMTPGGQSQKIADDFINPTGMIQKDASGNLLDSTGMGVAPSASMRTDSAGRMFDSGVVSGNGLMKGSSAAFGGGSGGNILGGPTGGGSSSGGLSGQIESTIGGMLSNPTGYTPQQEQMLRNRASEAIASQQKSNTNDVRLDAIRRGAAKGDADIRDQLNRVNAAGANGQARASFDVDKALADLARNTKLGAVGAGNTFVRNQQELEMLLAQMQEENGPLAGLSLSLGG